MKINPEIKQLLIYIAKCITGVALVFLLSSLLHYPDYGWCIISVILVLSPDSKEAVPLAVTRIKANLIGGLVSVLLLLFGTAGIFTISAAMAITIVLCYVFKLMAGSRSALAAVIIIMLHTMELGTTHGFWQTTLERIISVIIGCVLGLVVTFIFHQKLHYPAANKIKPTENEG